MSPDRCRYVRTLLAVWLCAAALPAHGQQSEVFSGATPEGWATEAANGPALETQPSDEGLRIVHHGGDASAKAILTRGVDPSQFNEIRVRFTLGEPAMVGFRVTLTGGGETWGAGIHDDGMFALYGPNPHYAGPTWTAGGEHEIRWLLGEDEFRVTVVTADGLPQAERRYTRPLPEAWRAGEPLTLSLVARSKGGEPGSVTLHAVTLYTPDDPRATNAAVSDTLDGSLAKYRQLRDGELTDQITAAIEDLSENTATAPAAKTVASRPFVVQLWDAHKLDRIGWDDARMQALAERFNLLQFRSPPRGEVLDQLAAHDLGLALYMTTRDPAYLAALKASPHAETRYLRKGEWTPRVNPISGDLAELATIQALRTTAPLAQRGLLEHVLLDSEFEAGVGDDPLARALAEADGVPVFNFEQRQGDAYTAILDDADPQWQFERWRRLHDTLNVTHRAIAQAADRLWPSLRVTSDPIMDGGALTQFRGLDAVQHWVRVHWAPRHPRSVAYFTERARAHVRGLPDRDDQPEAIIIGPQLGRDGRATPPDMFSEACWLAVAHGAQGVTHWGAHCIYNEDGTFAPGGEALWTTLQRLRQDLYLPNEALLATWRPAPRRVAVLVSMADAIHDSGNRHQRGDEAVENVYRAMTATGEPADVIYDEQVRADALADYQVLVVPSLYVADAAVVGAVRAFAERGGTVIAHSDSALGDHVSNLHTLSLDLAPRYRDYWIRKDEPSLTPDGYADFLATLTRQLREALPFAPAVQLSRADVVANLMSDGEHRYLVLVNDRRTYGPARETLGHPYMLDQGQANAIGVALDGNPKLINVATGEALPVTPDGRAQVTLAPGWGVILRVND